MLSTPMGQLARQLRNLKPDKFTESPWKWGNVVAVHGGVSTTLATAVDGTKAPFYTLQVNTPPKGSFSVGDYIQIGGPNGPVHQITGMAGSSISVKQPITVAHGAGVSIVSLPSVDVQMNGTLNFSAVNVQELLQGGGFGTVPGSVLPHTGLRWLAHSVPQKGDTVLVAKAGGSNHVVVGKLWGTSSGVTLPAQVGQALATQGGATLDDGSGNMTVPGNLTVDGSLTVGGQPVKGGVNLIQSQNIASGTTTAITFSSIPQTYSTLVLIAELASTITSGSDAALFRFNGDSGADYTVMGYYLNGTSTLNGYYSSDTSFLSVLANIPANGQAVPYELRIPGYSRVAPHGAFLESVWTTSAEKLSCAWNPATAAAITSITISLNSAVNFGASTASLYGLS